MVRSSDSDPNHFQCIKIILPRSHRIRLLVQPAFFKREWNDESKKLFFASVHFPLLLVLSMGLFVSFIYSITRVWLLLSYYFFYGCCRIIIMWIYWLNHRPNSWTNDCCKVCIRTSKSYQQLLSKWSVRNQLMKWRLIRYFLLAHKDDCIVLWT